MIWGCVSVVCIDVYGGMCVLMIVTLYYYYAVVVGCDVVCGLW